MLGGLIEGQLGRPPALSGRLMNAANARINRYAIPLLDPSPDHRLLEVGFGGGGSFVKIADVIPFPPASFDHALSVNTIFRCRGRDSGFGHVNCVRRGAFVFVLAEKV
jgi:hypothetical protein